MLLFFDIWCFISCQKQISRTQKFSKLICSTSHIWDDASLSIFTIYEGIHCITVHWFTYVCVSIELTTRDALWWIKTFLIHLKCNKWKEDGGLNLLFHHGIKITHTTGPQHDAEIAWFLTLLILLPIYFCNKQNSLRELKFMFWLRPQVIKYQRQSHLLIFFFKFQDM